MATIDNLHLLAKMSQEIDLRPDYLVKIEEKQKASNNRTEPIWYLNFLYLVAKLLPQRCRILEIGALHGASTAHLSAGCLGSGMVMSIDNDPNAWDFLSFHRDHSSTDNITPYMQNSLDANGRCFAHLSFFKQERGKPPLDLLFLDSTHEYEHCKKELELYLPFVKPSGVVLFDDIHLDAGMERFWAEIPEPKVDLSFLHRETGFGAYVKGEENG